MRTVGVDLATDDAKTALAVIDWDRDAARLVDLQRPCDDEAVIAALEGCTKAGIDCPLGWPDQFVNFLLQHRDGEVAHPEALIGIEGRRGLVYRRTDVVVRQRGGPRPLSVAADRIALTAVRAATIQARLKRAGKAVDRTGAGLAVEVYPAASLHAWELDYSGYKEPRNRPRLSDLVSAILDSANWLRLGTFEAECRRSDHAFDAVIAALTARAAACGQVTQPAPEDEAYARNEGWIAVPTCSLAALLGLAA